jgi:hypothetical protein
LRIMLEGEDGNKIARMGGELVEAIEQVMESGGRGTHSRG